MEKTCGNCGMSVPMGTVFCTRIGREVYEDDSAVNGDCWVSSELEQRCQQLEQLAKEMLRDQALMAFTARKEGAWETVEWIEGCMKESRKRLAALEVSLDD